MRKTSIAVLLFGLLILTQPIWAQSKASYEVHVDGMVCAFCVQGVEKQLTSIDGVTEVSVDLKTKIVSITASENAQISDESIREAIKNAGYNVRKIVRPQTTRMAPVAPKPLEPSVK
jgi:copper chaperone CopZ